MARANEVFEVINNSDEEYKEEYQGVIVKIPPRGKVHMARRDKARFMGQYVPYDRERSSGDKPISARLAKSGAKPDWNPTAREREEVDALPFKNEATGKGFATEEALDEDLKSLEHLGTALKLKAKED